MNKKGITMVPVYLILALLVGGILLFSQKMLFGTISEDVDDQTRVCKASIGKAFAGNIPCSPDLFPFKFLCETDLAPIDSENKEEIMGLLADEFYTCMWYVDRGKLNKNEWCDIYIDKTYCFDCSVIEFGDKARKLGTISIDEFTDYLKNKKLPNFDGSYYDYLFDADAYFNLDKRDNFDYFELENQVNEDRNSDVIDLNKDYILTYGLYLEPAIFPGGGGHFITLTSEESSLHQRLRGRCEYVI